MAPRLATYAAATGGKPALRSPAAAAVRSMTTTGPFWTRTTNAETVAGSTGPCTPTAIWLAAGTSGTAAVPGRSSGTELVWMGKPHSTASSSFGSPEAAMTSKPWPARYACRIASSWKSCVAAAVGRGRSPWATTSYPGQCGSTWVGSAASQVSEVSCLRSAIVGEPTTSPPAASRTPFA